MFLNDCHYVEYKLWRRLMIDNNNEPRVLYCGMQKCHAGHFFGPAVRSQYLLHYVLKGKGIYKVNNIEYTVTAGEAFLIKPHEVTFYKADLDNPWEYAWISFTGTKTDQIVREFSNTRGGYVFPFDDILLVDQYFSDFTQRFHYKNNLNSNEWIGYFYLLTAKIQKSIVTIPKTYDKNYHQIAVNYIRNNYSFELQINDICNFTGIERSYLYKIFMKYEGVSPKAYLIHYRINVAKEMLRNTTYTTTEVAYSCGFSNASSFCKHFMKLERLSPLQYRKSQLAYIH